jgi:2-polyprenyl-6-methoxyphenol hydroxylase-like FAD-dependent oxidoreductase
MDDHCAVSFSMDSVPPGTTRAVVAGGSLTGLLAAAALASYFDEVYVVERDDRPDTPKVRRGVPQAAHPHMLLAQGLLWIEQLVPGLTESLREAGAVRVGWPQDVRWHAAGERCAPRVQTDIYSYSCSRELLERQVRTQVSLLPNVTLLFGMRIQGLSFDAARDRVTGLRIAGEGGERTFAADLVIDATGRASRAREWLGVLGKTVPPVSVVHPHAGYASCQVTLPRLHWPDATYLLVRDPAGGRAGCMYHIEGDRFIATVIGVERDYPPGDFAGLLEFARTLPSRALYEVLKHATPLEEVATMRRTENRLVHYERCRDWSEGFIVLGDAACAFNPIYAQGMTEAAHAAVTLARCLAEHKRSARAAGFGRRFQRMLARANRPSWQLSTSADLEHARACAPGQRFALDVTLRHKLLKRVLQRALERPALTRAFAEVMNQLRSPLYLLRPSLMRQWLLPDFRARQLAARNVSAEPTVELLNE